ncbi:DUF6884 domain-containing protein [Natronorubrum sp. DTA28]|uniref:DUF6884 domain-containing protein n=1 Tax=Natronorubrum sp. DTA28 TaxID=3447019 RepID=UPI003F87E58A
MTEIILVGCSKSKKEGTHLARDLYEPSPIFRKRRRLALQRADHWGVLSAKFGYLRPWDVTPSYDTHISERSPVWAAYVLEDLLRDLEFYDADQVTILAGKRYIEPLVTPLEAHGYKIADPHRGLRPGERMSSLDEAVTPGKQVTLTGGGLR